MGQSSVYMSALDKLLDSATHAPWRKGFWTADRDYRELCKIWESMSELDKVGLKTVDPYYIGEVLRLPRQWSWAILSVSVGCLVTYMIVVVVLMIMKFILGDEVNGWGFLLILATFMLSLFLFSEKLKDKVLDGIKKLGKRQE